MAGQIFRTQKHVEFRDTDAGGIMHFSVFFLKMEEAEHELLRSLQLSVVGRDDQGEIGWPRVAAQCDYRAPAHFEDTLDLEISVERLGDKSITYRHLFKCGDAEVASGSQTTVCCRFSPGQPPRAISLPAAFRDSLAPFLAEG